MYLSQSINDRKTDINSTEELVKALKECLQTYITPRLPEPPMLKYMLNYSRFTSGALSTAGRNLAVLAELEKKYGTKIPRNKIVDSLRVSGPMMNKILMECLEKFPDAGKAKTAQLTSHFAIEMDTHCSQESDEEKNNKTRPAFD